MTNIEQTTLEASVNLMREALKFYADEKNYIKQTEGVEPLISLDKGHTAKQTLNTIQTLEGVRDNVLNIFNNINDEALSPENIQKQVEEYIKHNTDPI